MPRALIAAGLPLAAAAFSAGRPTALVNGELTVTIPARQAAALRDADQMRLVAGVVSSVLGQTVTLRLVGEGASGDDALDERQRRYRDAERHPLVQEILKRFEGDLTSRELVDLATWLDRVAAERESARRPVRPATAAVDTGHEAEVLDHD